MFRKGIMSVGLLAASVSLMVVGIVSWAALWPQEDEAAKVDIESMSVAEKEALAKKRERFRLLAPEEQERYRKLHADLTNHDDAEHLTRVLVNYNNFLNSLTSLEKAELADLPMAERVARIKEVKEEQDWLAFNQMAEESVEPEDLKALFNWVQRVAENHEDELIGFLMKDEKFDPRRLPKSQRDRLRFLTGTLIYTLAQNSLEFPTNEEIAELSDQLTENAKAFLNQDDERTEKIRRLRGWLFVGWMAQRRNAISDENLEKFFSEDLTEAERQRLDQKSPDDRRRTLRDMYLRRKMMRPQGGRGGPPRGGRGGRGPRESGRGPGRGGPPSGEESRPEESKPGDKESATQSGESDTEAKNANTQSGDGTERS